MSTVRNSAPDGAPDYYGLVAGVRTWRVANTMWAKMGGWLWSLAMLDCWRKGVEWKEAECPVGHRIPGDACACGIWAFYNPTLMTRELGPVRGGPDEPYEYVTGIIGGGGDVVPHELGFRAQYAKVLGIFSDKWPTPKEEIAEQHDCPILAPEEYDAFCEQHPQYRLIRLDRQ
jgi:hypothetical protein